MNEPGAPGGGESRPHPEPDDATLVLHEEQANVDERWEGVGYAGVRREVETDEVRGDYPRQFEQLAHEQVPVDENDSGKIETLPDGSISIPLFAEELVVTKETVLRERVVIRKETITEWQRVEAELRRERVSFETDDVPEVSGEGQKRAPTSAVRAGQRRGRSRRQ